MKKQYKRDKREFYKKIYHKLKKTFSILTTRYDKKIYVQVVK